LRRKRGRKLKQLLRPILLLRHLILLPLTRKTGELTQLSLTGLLMVRQLLLLLLLLLLHLLLLPLLQLLSKLLRTGQLRLRQVTGQLHQQLQLNKHQLPTLGEAPPNGDKHDVLFIFLYNQM
jgi:hypothetical protein